MALVTSLTTYIIVLRASTLWLSRYCTNMLYLSLAFCTKFTNKGLSYMANGKGCHKIVHLDLSGCEQVKLATVNDINDTLGCASSAIFKIVPHLDVIFDL